jgi:hypothetical protein
MQVWLVKCRKNLPDRDGWTWDWYFDPQEDQYSQNDEWGGPEWIRSGQSKKFIRDEVSKDDLVVCYQYEGKRICGFTRMARDGRDDPIGSRNYCMLHLASKKKAFCLEPPITGLGTA